MTKCMLKKTAEQQAKIFDYLSTNWKELRNLPKDDSLGRLRSSFQLVER